MNRNSEPKAWEAMRDEYERMPSQEKLRQLWEAVERMSRAQYHTDWEVAKLDVIKVYKNLRMGGCSTPDPRKYDPTIQEINGVIHCDCGTWTWAELFQMFGLKIEQDNEG